MIDHVSLAVRDLGASTAFYERVLRPLGMTLLVERDATRGFGRLYPELWLNARPGMAPLEPGNGAHVALRAPSDAAVDAFHTAALAGDGSCDGPPGARAAAMTTYYGAFIRDPDGNRIEAVHFPRDAFPRPQE